MSIATIVTQIISVFLPKMDKDIDVPDAPSTKRCYYLPYYADDDEDPSPHQLQAHNCTRDQIFHEVQKWNHDQPTVEVSHMPHAVAVLVNYATTTGTMSLVTEAWPSNEKKENETRFAATTAASDYCPQQQQPYCRRRFVVDGSVWLMSLAEFELAEPTGAPWLSFIGTMNDRGERWVRVWEGMEWERERRKGRAGAREDGTEEGREVFGFGDGVLGAQQERDRMKVVSVACRGLLWAPGDASEILGRVRERLGA